MDLARLRSEDVVLDVGCGNGAYSAELCRRGHMGLVLGVDASVGMLVAAQQAAPSAEVAVCDAGALPLVDGAASVVIAANMLYHVPEPAAAVSEFRRVLRPGGRVLVVLNVRATPSCTRGTSGVRPA